METGNTILKEKPEFSPRDFVSGSEVKWCPGCGNYSVIAQVQRALSGLGCRPETTAFISGIGCSSRFPYYMETYGMHSIHGRAVTIATGLKIARPELDVWVVTGDGDCLSIGGNHFIHLFRRNNNIKVMLFNNRIYALTKGQNSPSSEQFKKTASTPYGSLEQPVHPARLALASGAGFVACSMDKMPKHLEEMIRRSYQYRGASFLEIYQNCNIFNDGAFDRFTGDEKEENVLILEDGKPLIFGKDRQMGIRLDGYRPEVVSLDQHSTNDLWIHDEKDYQKAQMLANFYTNPDVPSPFGVLFSEERKTFEELMTEQLSSVREKRGKPDLDKILAGGNVWEV